MLEDEDNLVQFVSISNTTSNSVITISDSKPVALIKKPARPRKSRTIKDPPEPSPANKWHSN